jgi:sugar phosphate isomerase/epimerase
MQSDGISRRQFVIEGTAAGAAVAALGRASGGRPGPSPQFEPGSTAQPGGVEIGFHTAAFNSAYFSFEKCLAWAQRNGVRRIECGVIDGVTWAHGLGYYPHIAIHEDPVLLRRKMDAYGVRFSQIDAAYPLSGEDGPIVGVPYVIHAIRWAAQAGCPRVDTTDGLHAPEHLSEEQAMEMMKRSYAMIIEVAEAHGIIVNIEPHGHFTTRPEMMDRMLRFCDSPYLRMNMDTGNTYIAGQDPADFLARFLDRVDHVHIKDVSPSLAAAARGQQTGIGISHCALGEGVNAANIKKCLQILRDRGYSGVLSIECEGQGGPMIEKSLKWLRDCLVELKIPIAGSPERSVERHLGEKA